MILPVAKLGTLALKTICKPIARRIKKEATFHPQFRLFITNIAQANHRLTTTIQRQIYGHATDVAIRPLNEEKAVQAAADLLGELFVFMVVGVAVLFEVQRNARSEARKEEMRKQELEEIMEVNIFLHRRLSRVEALKQRDEDLSKEVEILKYKVVELEHLVKGRRHNIFSLRQADSMNDKVKT